MTYLLEGIRKAVELLVSFDREIIQITLLSLKVTITATAIATLLGVPIGAVVAMNKFPGKRAVVTLLNTLLALPTVVIGLTVYSLICRRGPLGTLGLLYTPGAIIIGDVILATPIIAALALSATKSVDARVRTTALSLGASNFQSALKILIEAKFALLAAIIAGFGRVIAEVGSAMMLGGNIKAYTRTLTTAIALETSKGEFSLAIALGVILLFVAFSINIIFHYFQQKE